MQPLSGFEKLLRERRIDVLHAEAEKRLRIEPDPALRLWCRFFIAECLLQTGRIKECLDEILAVEKTAGRLRIPKSEPWRFRIARTGAHALLESGKFREALRRLDSLVGISNPEDRLRILGDKAQIHARSGDFDRAEKIFKRLLRAYGAMRGRTARNNEAVLLHWIANLHLEQARYSDAIRIAGDALVKHIRLNNQAGAVRAESTRGAALLLMGLNREALTCYSRASDRAAAAGLGRDQMIAGLAHAMALRHDGRTDDALVGLKSAFKVAVKLDSEITSGIGMGIALCLMDLSKYRDAGNILNKCASPVRKSSRIRFELLKTEISFHLEKRSRAGIDSIRKSEFFDSLRLLPELRFETSRLLAIASLRDRRPREALRHFEGAMNTIDILQSGIGSPEGRIACLGRYEEIYRDAVRTALDLRDSRLAAAILERERRSALLSARDASRTEPPKEKRLKNRVRALISHAQGDATGRRALSPVLTRDLMAAERALTMLRLESIRSSASLPGAGRSLPGSSISSATFRPSQASMGMYSRDSFTRQSFPEGGQLAMLDSIRSERNMQLSYFLDMQGMAMIARDAAGKYRTVTVGRPRDLEMLIERLQDELAFAEMRMGAALLEDRSTALKDAARKLHRCLVAPVRDMASDGEIWDILPHSLIHLVPFAMLHNGIEWLVESHTLRMKMAESSGQAAAAGAPPSGGSSGASWRPRAKRAVIVVGDPHGLGHLNAEVAAVSGYLERSGWNTTVLRGAPPDRIIRSLADADLVHFAGHGILRSDAPLYSHLVSGTGEPLFVADILRGLPEHGRTLVVLSACETGARLSSQSGNILTVAGAFLAAGAGAVVAADRRVEDEATAQLMRAFYENLSMNRSPALSLTMAQRSMIDDAWTAHPIYWAPWRCIES